MEQKRILVVEDEAAIRHVLSTYLTKQGCVVDAAESAEIGLSHLEKETYNAVLVDIVLPGMDGLKMLAKIKEVSEDTEVIVMTSYASLDTATEAIRIGAYDYLKKPFDNLEEIWDTLKRALDSNELTLKNKQLVETLATQNEELSRTVMRRDTLIEAGKTLSGALTLHDLLDKFVEFVIQELDANRVSLMLVDVKTNELIIAASRGIPETIADNVRVRMGDGIAGKVAQNGEYLLTTESGEWPTESLTDNPESYISAPILLSIPIKTQQKILGVINITEKRTEGSYQESDVAYLQGLAGQAAVAIERARYTTALEEAIDVLKSTQDQLVITERLKALGEMAAGVAHDFNNTLNGILLTAQKLRMKSDSSKLATKELVDGLEVIETLSLQGAGSVRRIQEYTRIRKDQPRELVDLNEVVRKAIEMTKPHWKEKKNTTGSEIAMIFEPEDVSPIDGSEVELTQVVSNLIFNACEAMPNGGSLKITTLQMQNEVGLKVEDQGVGMSEEVKKRIFEPFFTTKDSGQGLGTSIIYGIVTRHGGKIDVKSLEGKGTEVLVLLPVSEEAPTQKEEENMTEPNTGGGSGGLLVVEDEEFNRNLFNEVLSDAGYQVFLAENGEKAFEIFDKENIDMVITDLSMPGISGWEVSKGIKERSPDTPVMLLSGWAVQEDDETARAKGVDFLMSKPVTFKDLLSAVGNLIAQRRAA